MDHEQALRVRADWRMRNAPSPNGTDGSGPYTFSARRFIAGAKRERPRPQPLPSPNGVVWDRYRYQTVFFRRCLPWRREIGVAFMSFRFDFLKPADPFYDQWCDLRRRWVIAWVPFLVLLPISLIATFALGSPWIVLPALLGVVSVVITQVHLARWPCPR